MFYIAFSLFHPHITWNVQHGPWSKHVHISSPCGQRHITIFELIYHLINQTLCSLFCGLLFIQFYTLQFGMTNNVDNDIIIHVFFPSKLCSCACCGECFELKTKVVRCVTKNINCWVDLVQQSMHIILFFLSQNLNSVQFDIITQWDVLVIGSQFGCLTRWPFKRPFISMMLF